MPYATVVSGTTITASWANANVRDQVITPFASTAARTSAITSPIAGMFAYQADTDRVDVYGTAWRTALHLGGWMAYVPTWSASTTPPAIGNGTLTGQWLQMGKILIGNFTLLVGSTTTFGTGFWRLTLPAAVVGSALLSGVCLDSSAGEVATKNVGADNNTSTEVRPAASTGGLTATQPFVWAVSDVLRCGFVAELA